MQELKSPETIINKLNEQFLIRHPDKAAKLIETSAAEEYASALKSMPTDVLIKVFENLTGLAAKDLLIALPEEKAVELLSQLHPNNASILLSRLDNEEQTHYLSLLKKDLANEIKEHMTYPYDTAANLMDSQVMTFRSEDKVIDVINRLRQAKKKNSFDNVFIIDNEMKLTARVEIQRLLFADDHDTLAKISQPVRAYVSAMDPKTEITAVLETYNVKELPVVNIDGHVLGIIRGQELLDALKEDAFANMQAMVGASKDERALSSPLFAVSKRLPWLNINLLTAFLAASVVGLFEETIAKYTALAILLPVVAGQSGNTGAQALAITMRGLALKEISTRQWLKVCWKEFNVGLINGIAIAVVTSIAVFFWSNTFGLSLIIFLSMILAMIIAGVAGALIPVILNKLGQDPAVASSIILTTVTDVFGFFTFLGIATAFSSLLN